MTLLTTQHVPEGYDVGKLCTEDPISVSRQFSFKFHVFFNKIIIKGKVLGTCSGSLLPARASEQGNVIRSVRVYICHQKKL